MQMICSNHVEYFHACLAGVDIPYFPKYFLCVVYNMSSFRFWYYPIDYHMVDMLRDCNDQ